MANSTDGTPAGHGAKAGLPDPPAGTGEHGEEAARWLYRDVDLTRGGRGDLVKSIIDGMADPERVEAWLNTEVARNDDANEMDGARSGVIAALNQRKQALDDGDVLHPDEYAAHARSVRENHPDWWATFGDGPFDAWVGAACAWLAGEVAADDVGAAPTASRSLASTSNTTSAPDASEATSLDAFAAVAGGDDDE